MECGDNYKFPLERMQEVYDSLDETCGMLMKDSEFRYWVEKIVEEEVSPYREALDRQYSKIGDLEREILGKERHIKDLLCVIKVDPETRIHAFDVSLDLLRSEYKDEVIKDIATSLYKIAEKGIIPRELITDREQPQKVKEGRWKRIWKAVKSWVNIL